MKKFKEFINENNYWETLSHEGNVEVEKLINEFLKYKISLEDLFKGLKNIDDNPDKFNDAEIAKETTNKVIERILDEMDDYTEDELVNVYQKIFYN